MTIFFPDIYSGQAGMPFKGTQIAMVKATQGTNYKNPDYANAKARAASAGAFFCAYHWLMQGNGSAQADYAFSVVGASTPLMLDWEFVAGSNPGVADAQAFINRYRALGGIVVLIYLPKWYWQGNIGAPSLKWFADAGCFLVASDYTSYSDTGPGWAGYGGMAVQVWQYTSSASFNGYSPVDFNAYKGTQASFIGLVKGAAVKPESLILQSGDSGPAVVYLQQRLNVWSAKITVDGDFGPATLSAVKAFQTKNKLTIDGVVGPATWTALDRSPALPNVVIPNLVGQSAGAAHNALVAVGLVPVGPANQEATDTIASTTPTAGTSVAAGSAVTLNSIQYHGEYVCGGMFDLEDLAGKLGYPVNTLLRMTATHYNTFGDALGALLGDILSGVQPWNTPVPAGVLLWCD